MAGKGTGGWGAGLKLREAGGAPKCLWHRSVEDQLWDLSRLTGARLGGGNASHVPPPSSYPLGFLPIHLYSSSPPPSLARRTHTARGDPGVQRTRPGTPAGSLGPKWVCKTLAPFPSNPLNSRGSFPVPVHPLVVSGTLQLWEPFPFPSHPSGVLVPSCLHFSSPFAPPMSYPVTRGFLPSPWVSRSLTSIW